MVTLTINGRKVVALEDASIMEAAKEAGISIPHLCYLKEINEIGACRLCCVEVEGEDKLIAACKTKVAEGMVVRTDTPLVREAAKMNLQMILSQHDGRCNVCVRNENCQLQTLAKDFNIQVNPYEENLLSDRLAKWDSSFPLTRDANKCIKCMRCIQVCDKVQAMSIWDLAATGGRTRVDVAENKEIRETDCTLCGQCIVNCPVGALRERDDIDLILDAIRNPDITTVVQVAPAVRTAWAEDAGIEREEAGVDRLCGALKEIGFDYVFDTSFSADLTIMEEASEFIERLTSGDLSEYPMFTSCCPGWVRFIKARYPELVGQLSTAKSPQQMFGAVIKSYFAEQIQKEPKEIFSVSIMPCVSKKGECVMESMKGDSGVPDVDAVLTTRELVRLLRMEQIDAASVEAQPFDSLMQSFSGAGVIFGVTGGVMEAALRSAAYFVTGENPAVTYFLDVRDHSAHKRPWREATYLVGDVTVRVAIASGLANADRLCRAILKGDVKYDFVEIMACPNGCAGGGGQPIHVEGDERYHRGDHLYALDRKMPLRFSHENPDIVRLYDTYLGKPLSEKAHHLLHTEHGE
ncbi:MAG: [Lachnospiraceae bacterium]|nr:[FeFe] hydrogenase, group A [Lachnospiraceae bacterium]